ncbi:Transcription elongation factor SPT6 [Geodia barretti]|uniref:Suppressor of Ty 6 homolog n=1 Tax=Geodia barretti TaxID=519541 RepID=A0AA35WLP0_GEOBA|nr:Transcription elongation factor SPT6 [Geodia barretti]
MTTLMREGERKKKRKRKGDDSDDEELPPSGLSARQGGESRRDLDEEEGTEEEGPPTDDMGDFIVGDDGRPINISRPGGMDAEPALLEAQEIFGLDFDDPNEFARVAEEGLGSEEEEEEEEDEYLSGEEEEEEDEVGGSQRRRRRRLRKARKKTSIYDVYEPSELERGFFTDRDKDIRVTDMPERFQTRSLAVQKTEEGELDEEAEWIFQNVFSKHPISKQPLSFSQKPRGSAGRGSSGTYSKPPSAVPKIREALNFMRNHSFEVPFIANYRKEYVEPELDVHDLWTIWQSDEKWMQLKQRKAQMVRLFKRLQDYQFEKVREQPDKALTEDTRPVSEEDIARLKAVKTAEELSDVFAQFSLYYGRDLVDMQHLKAMQKRQGDNEDQELEVTEGSGGGGRSKKKTAIKQAHRKTFYVACQEAGLGSLAAKFGLTPEQFGENLRDNYQRHETDQHTVEPEEVAQDYVQPSGVFTSVRKVLQGACHMVSLQLAAEPLVRQAVRQVFQTRALLNVKPTKKGKKLIDDTHPCAGMKYMRNKPVRDLAGADFLRLVQAEGEGLLEMKIGIDLDQGAQDTRRGGGGLQSYFEEIRQLFYRDEFSRLVEKWNAQRAQAVYSALVKFLYPLMQKELYTKLLIEAKEHVLRSCVQTFRDWLDGAPLAAKKEEDEEDRYLSQGEGPFTKVVAVAFGSDKMVPAFCCALDSTGSVVDYRRLPNILKRRISPSERERNEKEKDLESFKDFVSRKRPEAVALAAESRDALMLADDLSNALVELEGEEGVPVVPVELVTPDVAKIFSKSPRAKESFPEYPELLCEAISLGRRHQEPLLEFSSLACAEDDELLSLKMDPLQSSLDTDDLRSCLELELVTRVNDVGVDINFCLENPHGVGMLPFVCGLGPRKAMFLLKILKQENSQLKNRSELVTQCSTGPQVFINCAGFIRIDTNAFTDTDNTYIEVLDSTRVHPETYEWGRKMAVDALEYDETGDESHPSAAVEDILLTPDKLRDLDLDAFAEELERQVHTCVHAYIGRQERFESMVM